MNNLLFEGASSNDFLDGIISESPTNARQGLGQVPRRWSWEPGSSTAERSHHCESLVIKDGPHVEVFNAVSLHGGQSASWPVESPVTSKRTVLSLVEHWRAAGLPNMPSSTEFGSFPTDRIHQVLAGVQPIFGSATRALIARLGDVPTDIVRRPQVVDAPSDLGKPAPTISSDIS